MTEREAWLLLAERWDRPKMSDDIWVNSENEIGLCTGIDFLEVYHRIDRETAEIMASKIPKCATFAWPTDQDGARQRAAFCREQASLLEAQEVGKC